MHHARVSANTASDTTVCTRTLNGAQARSIATTANHFDLAFALIAHSPPRGPGSPWPVRRPAVPGRFGWLRQPVVPTDLPGLDVGPQRGDYLSTYR